MAPVAVDSVLELAQRPFLDLAPELSDALLYFDAGAGELAHCSLGLPFLFGLGAANVCELEGAHPDDMLLPTTSGQQPNKLAIFVTQLLTDVHHYILRAVSVHPTMRQVVIFSSVSEHAHALQAATDLGVEAFTEYAALLRQDVREAKAAFASQHQQGLDPHAADVAITVRAFPLHMCALDGSTFVLPAASSAASLARAGGMAAGFGGADTIEESDGEGISRGLSLLAHALLGIVSQMSNKLEVHALGPVAQQLAQEISTTPLPASSEGVLRGGALTTPTVSLILVDRSMDMLSPCLHLDHILDSLLARSARRLPANAPPRTPSVAQHISWRPLDTRLDGCKLAPMRCPLPGHPLFGVELLNPTDRTACQRLEHLLARKQRDALLLLRKMLKEAMRGEAVAQAVRSKAGAVTASELTALAECLITGGSDGCALRQRNIAALALGAAHVMGPSAEAERWQALASLERSLLATLSGQGGSQEREAVITQMLLDALSRTQSDTGLLRLADVVSLLALLYSAAPDFVDDRQQQHHQHHFPQPHRQHRPTAELGGPSPFGSEAAEASVRNALADTLFAADEGSLEELPQLHQRLMEVSTGPEHSAPSAASSRRQVSQQVVAELFTRLRVLSGARSRLQQMRHVTAAGDVFAEVPTMNSPLLRQLIRRILQQADLKDLTQPNSSALRGVFTSVLGGMMAAAAGGIKGGVGALGAGGGGGGGVTSRLHECGVILVFVVGGLSIAEVREVRQELDEFAGSRPQVLLGGTTLLTQVDVARQLTAGVCAHADGSRLGRAH